MQLCCNTLCGPCRDGSPPWGGAAVVFGRGAGVGRLGGDVEGENAEGGRGG